MLSVVGYMNSRSGYRICNGLASSEDFQIRRDRYFHRHPQKYVRVPVYSDPSGIGVGRLQKIHEVVFADFAQPEYINGRAFDTSLSDADWETIPPVARKCATALARQRYPTIIHAMAEDDATLLEHPGVYAKHLRRLRKWCYKYALTYKWPNWSTKKWWLNHTSRELSRGRLLA